MGRSSSVCRLAFCPWRASPSSRWFTRCTAWCVARLRARPWLVAASVALLTVCVVFAGAVGWFLREVQTRPPALYFLQSLDVLMAFDLAICLLVALATVLTGQAIVAYEIFTGKALPRGGLRRYWRRCLVLAAGYGVVMGASFAIPLEPSYRLLLATTLMTLFFALVGWRSYSDHERSIHGLQPFIRSQRLYDHLVHPVAPDDVDVELPFRALCANVLEARVAYLVALGPLAPLVGPALVYPSSASAPSLSLADLATRVASTHALCTRIAPHLHGGAIWAVPLWSERGLIGVLLLGEKAGGGLYTEEEIEVARATGERLIDTRASTEMALRLMSLQRRRIQESQVIDRRARQVLHDDVLPRLHTAMLLLSSQTRRLAAVDATSHAEAVAMLADVHRYVANLLHDMPAASELEAVRLGMLGTIRHTLDGELQNAFDAVRWHVDPEAEQLADELPPLSVEVLAYAAREAIRNAARHGRGTTRERPLTLHVWVRRYDGLQVVIEDDGVGVAAQPTRTSTGHGLALHTTMMAVVGGTLAVESEPDRFTRVSLTLPLDVYAGIPVPASFT
jgi:signal transduction histidine kinase